MTISHEEIEADDRFFNPGWFSPDLYAFDNISKAAIETGSANVPGEIITLKFELNRTFKLTQRRIYNTLDLLGDVGGLFDALKIIA